MGINRPCFWGSNYGGNIMAIVKHGMTLALKEHLASGEPITGLEATTLFGVANMWPRLTELKRQGWMIESRKVPFAVAVRRINKYAVYQPPKNLPVKDIMLTEYWVNK
jgi:hypothetical protein